MLTLSIRNFKCFKEIEIPLRQLTVLAGANGKGKSTAIQALLFLRRTIEHCAKWELSSYELTALNGLNVELNGAYCLSLGNSGYVLPVDFEDTEVNLGLIGSTGIFNVKYSTNTGNELWLTPIEPLVNDLTVNPLYYQEFYYLNAERIGPRVSQGVKFYDYPNVGYKGEYTAQVISDLNYNFKVEEDRTNQEFLKGSRFEHHINAWLDFILDGASIIPHYDDKTHTARVEVESSYSKGTPLVPTNTGFGISYSLPIIVSGLIAKKARFFIVENPEAHLHPAAQSKLGYFLGVIANAGVRIIVETHSDHIINGIQIAVAKKKVASENLLINFFSGDRGDSQPTLTNLLVSEKGELSSWPKGFFDQTQIDYAKLISLRRQ